MIENFDVVVIGGGSGLNISSAAASFDLKVALIEEGPLGGTCLNRGCIPSKMLIHTADIAETILKARKFGIDAKIKKINFKAITGRVSRVVDEDSRDIEEGIHETENITLFKARARFIGRKTIEVGSKVIYGNKIFIMAGTRPLIPPIPGLRESGFMTSREALRLKKKPKTITIIGGGYIAAELAHFFGALGTKVNILQRDEFLVNREDPEISERFTKTFSRKYNVFLGYAAERVQKKRGVYTVTASHGNIKKRIKSDALLLAVGRIPNSDLLDVARGGIKTDERGYIKTNDYLEASARGVWAGGDIAGKYFFKHSANLESGYMWHNAISTRTKKKVDYFPMPHAIFSSPQIAGVGVVETQLKPGSYRVSKYYYEHTGMGAALQDKEGFVKMIIEKKTRKILGCHIIGPDASAIIQEVVMAMKMGDGKIENISNAIHVHPALSEVVQRAATLID